MVDYEVMIRARDDLITLALVRMRNEEEAGLDNALLNIQRIIDMGVTGGEGRKSGLIEKKKNNNQHRTGTLSVGTLGRLLRRKVELFFGYVPSAMMFLIKNQESLITLLSASMLVCSGCTLLPPALCRAQISKALSVHPSISLRISENASLLLRYTSPPKVSVSLVTNYT